MDADGAESPGGLARTIWQHQFRLGEHHMAYQPAILLHHEVKLRNEVRIAPVTVEHIMLGTSRAIYIPKSLAGENLHLTVIFRSFKSDFHSIGQLCSPLSDSQS